MSLNKKEIYKFGDFRLDVDERMIERIDGGQLQTLPTKTFDVLVLLVRKQGHLVTKDEFLAHVWPNTIVEENNLEKRVYRLRQFLNEKDSGSKYIETVRGHGYRFVAPVHKLEVSDSWLPATHRDGGLAGYTGANVSAGQINGVTIGIPPRGIATPEGISYPSSAQHIVTKIRQHKVFSIAMLGLLVLAVAAFRYLYLYGSTAPAINSVAVLPFVNGSGDPEMDYLSDGLSESLIDRLSQVSELKVIARASSFKYRDPDIDLADVGRKLGVGAVVTGRVTQSGGQLIVRAELVAIGENEQIWGEQYVRKPSDAMAIQQEIAMSISHNLHLKLTGAEKQGLASSGTSSPEAYELRLKGEYWSRKPWSPETARNAHQFYEQAVAADPGYALAWAELSQSYSGLAVNTLVDPLEVLPLAEAAARRAIELDDNLPEGHMAYGAWLKHQWRWREAEAELRRAVDLNPNRSDAHMAYSQLLIVLGRSDEAIRAAQRALELDPLSGSANRSAGFIYNLARRYDEQLAVVQKALELDPNNSYAHLLLAYYYLDKGMQRESIDAFLQAIELGDDSTTTQIYLGMVYAWADERDKALAILQELQTTKDYVSPAELPALLVALGMVDEAFASFEKAIAVHDLDMQFLKVDSAFDPLHDDPRFVDLVRRVGLP